MTIQELINNIKKEIKRIAMVYMIVPTNITKSEEYRSDVASTLKLMDEILDKYNKQEDYSEESERVQYLLKFWSHLQLAREYEEAEKFQKAWGELKETHDKLIKVCKTEDELILLGVSGVLAHLEAMQELEQKHGIGE